MITENITKIKQEIKIICSKINRPPEDIILLAATKGISQDKIKEAISAGIDNIGENYIQEARQKYFEGILWKEEEKINVKWHFIGHLQKNKVKYIDIFDLIHSVDSIDLAEEINNYSRQKNKTTPILLQISISGEKTKFGIKKEDAFDNIYKISKFPNLKVEGFMTITPLVAEAEEVRWIFKEMYNLYKEVKGTIPLKYLSMGMSQDWKVALEEGANIIRLKTAIFG